MVLLADSPVFSLPDRETVQATEPAAPSLCSPGWGLGCFYCCPPIRPAGFDPFNHQKSLRRLFSENRADFLAGRLPEKAMVGFWCDGLGFLKAGTSLAGCLFHPARNQGRDLRNLTGYGEKCRREWCLEGRAFALIPPEDRDRLAALCQGMDSFRFSSRKQNPLMRLLGFGPEVAQAAAALPKDRRDLDGWRWLQDCDPAWGWLMCLGLREKGPDALHKPEQLTERLGRVARRITARLMSTGFASSGPALADLCSPWEARFWRALTGRRHATALVLCKWREIAHGEVYDF